MKNKVLINLTLTGLAIAYMLSGYEMMYYLLCISSLFVLLLARKYNYIKITLVALFIFVTLIFYRYNGGLYFNVSSIILNITLSLNSAMLIEILESSHCEELRYYSYIFNRLYFIFILFLIVGLAFPDAYIAQSIYPQGKLSLITTIVILFGPYVISSQYVLLLNGFNKMIKYRHV